jgi:hypothetical protein
MVVSTKLGLPTPRKEMSLVTVCAMAGPVNTMDTTIIIAKMTQANLANLIDVLFFLCLMISLLLKFQIKHSPFLTLFRKPLIISVVLDRDDLETQSARA